MYSERSRVDQTVVFLGRYAAAMKGKMGDVEVWVGVFHAKVFAFVAFVTATALSAMWLGWAGLRLQLVLGETVMGVGLWAEYEEVLVLVRSTVVILVSLSGKLIQGGNLCLVTRTLQEEFATTVVTRGENNEPAEQLVPLA
jgi:hypothetical protein